MPREKKDHVVIATAPDGDRVVLGTMRRSEALELVDEINATGGFSADMPIFGPAGMWQSFKDAKSRG